MAENSSRINRVIPGKELPFTDFKGMSEFIKNKLSESSRPAVGEDFMRDGNYGIDKDLPIEITDRSGNTVTMTFEEYRMVSDQIMDQVLRDKSAELCFTDIAFGDAAGSSADLSDGAWAGPGLQPADGEGREEAETVPETPVQEEEPEQDSPGREEPSSPSMTERAAEGKGLSRAAGQANIQTPRKTPGRKQPGTQEKRPAGKTKSPRRTAPAQRRPSPSRTAGPAKQPSRTGQAKAPAGPAKRTARPLQARQAAQAKQPVQTRPVRHLDEIMRNAQTTDRLNRSSQFIVARAAFIADQSGRTASFVNKNGQRLEFRRVTDPKTGAKEPKAFVDGREIKTAQEAELFIKNILKSSPQKAARDLEMLVSSAAENPTVNRGALEKQIRPQHQEKNIGRSDRG